jgi:hypothetical protein
MFGLMPLELQCLWNQICGVFFDLCFHILLKMNYALCNPHNSSCFICCSGEWNDELAQRFAPFEGLEIPAENGYFLR